MKLQQASRKEIVRISIGVLICDAIMILTLLVLSLVGVGTFSLFRILLGAFFGSIVAIANFTLLCLTVQRAAETEDQRLMKRRFQLSYNLRLLIQAAWVVVCFAVPQIHFAAGAAPILYPNIVIYFLQIRGKLVSPSTRTGSAPLPDDDEPEDKLESFEV